MKHVSTPCPQWAEKLAARHPYDLSPHESFALNVHLTSCSACADAYSDYASMEYGIRALPSVEPLEVLPSQLPLQQQDTVEQSASLPFVTPQEREAIGAFGPLLSSYGASESSVPSRLRLTRFATIAAVVITLLLLGSSLALFEHRSFSGPSGASSTPILSHPVRTPDCQGLDYDDSFTGLGRVCSKGLFQPIHESASTAHQTVTLEWAYADANRVVVMYTIIDPHHPSQVSSYRLENATLSTQQGMLLPAGGGGILNDRVQGGGEILVIGNMKPKMTMSYIQFDAVGIPANTHSLILHLQGSIGQNTNPNLAHSLLTATGHYDFTFSVPFHTGRRVNVQKTVTAAGIRMTLDHVIVTPSEIRYYMSGFVQLPSGVPIKSGQDPKGVQYNYTSPTGAAVGDVEQGKMLRGADSHRVFITNFSNDVFDTHGTCVLQLVDNYTQGGTWKFQFIV